MNTTEQESVPFLQDDPVDLWDNFDPPELPEGLLPPLIEQFALLNGKQIGADLAGLAVAALVTCAAAIPDQVQIKVKRHDKWKESARLWAAMVRPPSAKKSPIISRATAPECGLEINMMRAWQERVQKYKALLTEKQKGKQRPPQTRPRIEDATIEATQLVLEGSPWGVLLLQDELSGFFGAMDKYNAGKGAQADRAFWLRSFNGGQYAINRVIRGATVIDNVSVSMLGGIQPEPLIKISSDAADDGLLQRLFSIMLSTTPVGRDEPMLPINDCYAELISSLRKTSLPGILKKHPLEFDDGAQAIRRSLEAKHLELQSLETINRKLASHIGKYDGLFARLCIIRHCVEHSECATADVSDRELPVVVTERTAQRVADFLHQFYFHTLWPSTAVFWGCLTIMTG
ncbi:YfjI family protein [Paracoccaceae bacterium]|nr:YfjI family protein [Paracoccaceae bacterium]